jgi:hypothetical protein
MSAGAMVLCERVIVYDDLAATRRDFQLYDRGLALVRDIQLFPHCTERIQTDDPDNLAYLARRFRHHACVGLNQRSFLLFELGAAARDQRRRGRLRGGVRPGGAQAQSYHEGEVIQRVSAGPPRSASKPTRDDWAARTLYAAPLMTPDAQRLRTAFALFETGCDLMRQNLRRRHPGDSEAQIQARLEEWLRRPGGEHPGRPYTFRFPP